jgi:hypothetical protein
MQETTTTSQTTASHFQAKDFNRFGLGLADLGERSHFIKDYWILIESRKSRVSDLEILAHVIDIH